MRRRLLYITLSLAMMISLAACGTLDIIGDYSIKSFQSVLTAMEDQVTQDPRFEGWSLAAPDKEARVVWSRDYSKTAPDLFMEVEALPFMEAGLDTSKLPEGMFVDGKIIVGIELGSDALPDKSEASPLAAYEQIVKRYRDNITYHAALDHFGISLSGGNVFEWAKDMTNNDKDIVFVLNPEPLITAGVDPDKVDGWVFATVETMDEKGKDVKVDKFLKPFNLEIQ